MIELVAINKKSVMIPPSKDYLLAFVFVADQRITMVIKREPSTVLAADQYGMIF